MIARLTLAACLLSSGRAHAEEERSETEWYGWKILAVDAALVVIGLGSLDGDNGEVAVAAAAGLVLSGPIAHLAHDRRGAAGGSFALRLLLPATGMLLGSASGHSPHDGSTDGHDYIEGALGGAAIGYAIALGIDLVTARRQVPSERPVAVPLVAVGRTSTTVGMAFEF